MGGVQKRYITKLGCENIFTGSRTEHLWRCLSNINYTRQKVMKGETLQLMFQQPMTTKGLMSGFYCTTCREMTSIDLGMLLLSHCYIQPDGCLWERVGEGWSEPAATNAPVQNEAVQAVLRMNPNTSSPPSPGIFIFLFPCPGVFQPSYLPQSFLLLPTFPTLNPKP